MRERHFVGVNKKGTAESSTPEGTMFPLCLCLTGLNYPARKSHPQLTADRYRITIGRYRNYLRTHFRFSAVFGGPTNWRRAAPPSFPRPFGRGEGLRGENSPKPISHLEPQNDQAPPLPAPSPPFGMEERDGERRRSGSWEGQGLKKLRAFEPRFAPTQQRAVPEIGFTVIPLTPPSPLPKGRGSPPRRPWRARELGCSAPPKTAKNLIFTWGAHGCD
jgi:hypothetical protein